MKGRLALLKSEGPNNPRMIISRQFKIVRDRVGGVQWLEFDAHHIVLDADCNFKFLLFCTVGDAPLHMSASIHYSIHIADDKHKSDAGTPTTGADAVMQYRTGCIW